MGTRTESPWLRFRNLHLPSHPVGAGRCCCGQATLWKAKSPNPVSSSPCVRNAPLLDPGTPDRTPTIGRRLAGQTAQGGSLQRLGWLQRPLVGGDLRPRDDSFRARPIFSATTPPTVTLLSGGNIPATRCLRTIFAESQRCGGYTSEQVPNTMGVSRDCPKPQTHSHPSPN